MASPHSYQLHFACSFDLAPVESGTESWSELAKIVRQWLVKKTNAYEDLGKQWFFLGGRRWRPQPRSRVLVATERVIGKGSDTAPEFWVARYEHPCDDVAFRQWRTDIGLSMLADGRYSVSLATTHWILPEYVGEDPPTPLPTSPAIVSMLLSSRRWTPRAGSEPLAIRPRILRAGEGAIFHARLVDPQRRCPIILVTLDSVTAQPKVDAGRLTRLLAGAASVYVADSADLVEELSYLLPWSHRCTHGMLRIYQANTRFELQDDSRRHRFFTSQRIDVDTPAVVENVVVKALVRQSRTVNADGVTSIEDVISKQQTLRLLELRSRADTQSDQALVELQNSYITLLETERDGLLNERRDLQDAVELLDLEKEESKENLAGVQAERDSFRTRALRAEAQVGRLEERLAGSVPESVPVSVAGVLAEIRRLVPDRIAVTDQGLRSAQRATFKDLSIAWSCLRSMALDLHDLVFGEEEYPGTLEQAFHERTGFELALTENKNTKRDKKLMALRTQKWSSKEIDITPHVKHGNREPRCLRVHYYADHERRLIVIGHCGDHLDTYGTQWMS
jgi:hypothetical protein